MSVQERDPCPYRIFDDIGGAFAMGAIGPVEHVHLHVDSRACGPALHYSHVLFIVKLPSRA